MMSSELLDGLLVLGGVQLGALVSSYRSSRRSSYRLLPRHLQVVAEQGGGGRREREFDSIFTSDCEWTCEGPPYTFERLAGGSYGAPYSHPPPSARQSSNNCSCKLSEARDVSKG